jgi:hypothetical protein
VRAAAAATNLSLDELGPGVGTVVDDLHTRLQQYDIVFATGRMALEALASGCSVVIADSRGLAGLVRSDTVDAWRRHNLGQRLLDRPVSVAGLVSEIERYDAADARAVSLRVRDTASLSAYLQAIEEIYRSIGSAQPTREAGADSLELAAFYESVLKRLGEAANVDHLDLLNAQLKELHADRSILQSRWRLLRRFFALVFAKPLSVARGRKA